MKTEWTLKEMSDWTRTDSEVKIPAIQRGLVWKPHQVELLWDSILRKFPIGAFTLSHLHTESTDIYNLIETTLECCGLGIWYSLARRLYLMV